MGVIGMGIERSPCLFDNAMDWSSLSFSDEYFDSCGVRGGLVSERSKRIEYGLHLVRFAQMPKCQGGKL